MEFLDSPVTFILIGINVICSLIGFSNPEFVDKLILWPYMIKRNKQYYRMITSGFLHADWVHMFFNMFTFYFFGKTLEKFLTTYELGGYATYIIIYFGALIVSDIPSYLKHKDQYNYRALGASGAVSAVVFAAIVFNPWSPILLFGAVPLSAFLYAVLFIIYCIYMDKKGADNINHNAHLWGAIYGLVVMILFIAMLQPQLFNVILEELKRPSLFGRF